MRGLFGNLQGLKASQIRDLERLANRRTDRSRMIGIELARELGEKAWEIGRNIGLLIDRAGRVHSVHVGGMHVVPLPENLGSEPQPGRLKGLRFVRTDLRRQLALPEQDRELIVRHRFDVWVRLLLDEFGEILWLLSSQVDPSSFLVVEEGGTLVVDNKRQRLTAVEDDFLERIKALEEELGRQALGLQTADVGERALLVGIKEGGLDGSATRMEELIELSRSALVEVVGVTFQRRSVADPRTWIGKGKVQEINRMAVAHAANILIIDRELSGRQVRNLANSTGLEVIDRSDLILRIFERRAKTRLSRVRVALARLRYQLPRLVNQAHGLSRIGRGGFGVSGVRGKGESKLEIQRRRMRERIHRLESLLERGARQQKTRRKGRVRSGIPICSLVGYTNAGKSAWLNALTEANVLSESLLFATLDTTVRRTRLPEGTQVLIGDTVGFLRELPPGLLDAFRSTLEELAESQLLIHIVDVASPDWEEKQHIVEETLVELGYFDIPRLTIFNKADLVDRAALAPLIRKRDGELLSALAKEDRTRMRSLVEQRVRTQ